MSATSQRRTGHVSHARLSARCLPWCGGRWGRRRRAHGVGGNETGARSGRCLCSSATVQTASYNDQMRENERKQICSSQANEYTYKRPTTRPSPMRVTRSPPSPSTGGQLQTHIGIFVCFLGLCRILLSRMHYWTPESYRVFFSN